MSQKLVSWFFKVDIQGRLEGFALLGVGIAPPQTQEQSLGLGAGGIHREN